MIRPNIRFHPLFLERKKIVCFYNKYEKWKNVISVQA